jgi:hypothetical protein
MGNKRRGSQLMTGITCALAGSGGSIYAGTATVTVGFASGGSFTSYGKGGGGQGSIAPTTWANSGLTVDTLKDVYNSGVPAWLDFTVVGSAPNSGWSTLTIGGTTINRVDGSYTNNGTSTSWIFYGASTVFGTTVGDTRAVVWA